MTETTYRCDRCNLTWSTALALKQHRKNAHQVLPTLAPEFEAAKHILALEQRVTELHIQLTKLEKQIHDVDLGQAASIRALRKRMDGLETWGKDK